jgi:enediyne biosynthesis protein E4
MEKSQGKSKIAAIVAIAALVPMGVAVRYSASPPKVNPPVEELARLAGQYRFTPLPMPEIGSRPATDSYPINPALYHVRGWFSAVGAGVAFADFDNDGLSNDMCIIEPRTRDIILAPAPGTGERYAPFTLEVGDDLFDAGKMTPSGCLAGDFNEDGLRDMLITYQGRSPVLLLRRAEPETGAPGPLTASAFKPVPLIPGHTEPWYTPAATLADVDGDGHIDIVLGNYHREGEEVLDPNSKGRVEMFKSFSRGFNGGLNHIFLWQGARTGSDPSVTFEEAKDVFQEKESRGWTLAVGAADLDQDGLPELYYANDFGPDNLYKNNSTPGKVRLTRLSGERGVGVPYSKVLGQDSYKGMGVDFGDVNGDGYFDIFVSNISREFSLTEGHFLWVSTGEVEKMKSGKAPYEDKAEVLGVSLSDWGWDSKLVDFNNDGVLEAVQATGFLKGEADRWPQLAEFSMGNDVFTHEPALWPAVVPGHDVSGSVPNPFYVRAASGVFYDIAEQVGLGGGFNSRGVATADVDGDGDLDMALANQWEPSIFYRNDAPAPGKFLALHVLQPVASQTRTQTAVRAGHPQSPQEGWAAIGAHAVVTLPDGRKLVGQVDGGNGHSGRRSPELHFGLGNVEDTAEIRVKLKWRAVGGALYTEELVLNPGWHTVLLGAQPRS